MASPRTLDDLDDQIRAWSSTFSLNLAETYKQLREADTIRQQLDSLPHPFPGDEDADPDSRHATRHGEAASELDKEEEDFDTVDGQFVQDFTDIHISTASKKARSMENKPQTKTSIAAITREVDSRVNLLRARANSLSKPRIRHLNALSLPTEIWSMILEYLQPELAAEDGSMLWGQIWRDTGDPWDSSICFPGAENELVSHPGLQTIRNLRLVCRHFNALSSPYMCPILNITLKSTSIRHAEKLCRHPLILKGIICVQIWLQSYSKELAERMELWAHMRELELSQLLPVKQRLPESNLRLWWRDVAFPEGLPKPRPNHHDLEQLDRRKTRTLRVLHQLATRDPEAAEELQKEDTADENDWRIMCEEGWRAYGRAYERQQQLIEDGSFANRVGAVLAHMDKAMALSLRTGNKWYGWPKPRDMMQNGHCFKQAMQRPHSWCKLDQASGEIAWDVARLLFQIPVACHRAGAAIRSFAAGHIPSARFVPNMGLDGKDDLDPLRCTEEELYSAFAAVEQIWIEVKQRNGFPKERLEIDGVITYAGPKEASIYRLYRTLFASPRLTHVFGAFNSWGDIHRTHVRRANLVQFPLSLVLPDTGRCTPQLRQLELRNVSLTQRELVRCLHGLCAQTDIVYLADVEIPDAQWPVIWDIMRKQMEGAKRPEVFMVRLMRDGRHLDVNTLGKASLYARGALDENPGPYGPAPDEFWT
jgi:hypothetical protein